MKSTIPVTIPTELAESFVDWLTRRGDIQFRYYLKERFGETYQHVTIEQKGTGVVIFPLNVNGSEDHA